MSSCTLILFAASTLRWQLRRGAEVIDQGESASFAEVRGLEIRAGATSVTIEGPDTPALREAARVYGWTLGPSLTPPTPAAIAA